MARPRNLRSDPTPKVVSRGTVSKPKKPAKWNPSGRRAHDVTPYTVQAPL